MAARFYCVDPHGAFDVLQPLLAKVGELNLDLAAYVVVGGSRDADATRLCDTLKPRSDVEGLSGILCVRP